ncbi:MAG TPA: substrate-binding domain-containing protein [Thermoanaerobaculia bacterium]|nr:substrate-binding domain-containing protein [Thermoanaerobaculia bacterium]
MKAGTRGLIPVLLSVLVIAGCMDREQRAFSLGTTTSIENSGLLAHLTRAFHEHHGIAVRPIVVGSGKALRLAEQGTIDLVLSHDRHGEQRLLQSGRVALYRQFMRNDFVIAGPAENPAGLEQSDTPSAALAKIASSGNRFASRGDQSGTHIRELSLWREAGIDPRQRSFYYPLGQSMSSLLRSSSELRAYVLTDRATFEQVRSAIALTILIEDHPSLENLYAVTLMQPTARNREEWEHARLFAEWLLSAEGMAAISSFTIRGRTVFVPIEPGRVPPSNSP